MRYYAEFGGGLGDVFQQIYTQGLYAGLSQMKDGESAEVAIISHNPHVSELFTHHPMRAQMEVRNLGYWNGDTDAEMRKQHRIPPYRNPEGKDYYLRDMDSQPEFYMSPEDKAVIESEFVIPSSRYILFSVCAGLPDRDIPTPVVDRLVLMALEAGFIPVFVGRTYERFERGERWRNGVPAGCVNLIDRLTVPGVARLAQLTTGSVCCHSSLSMLGWYLRKPQFLLYPISVIERHFLNRDQWSFGLRYQECFHECFTEPTWEVQADGFFDYLTVLRNAHRTDRTHVTDGITH